MMHTGNNKQGGGKVIYILCKNHFDLIWRRGFKKPYYYNNERYASSSQVQEACINEWIEMTGDSEIKFIVESSLVLRTYLEKHPEQLDYLKQLAKEGRFELLASGEVIPDTNMPTGETLVRNLMYGILWGEEMLGVPINIGCLNDAFGASAQLPQIFKGCDVDILTGISYKQLNGKYWKGLDGSVIRFLNGTGSYANKRLGDCTHYYCKPCPICKGEGCESCLGRGFDLPHMDGDPDDKDLDLESSLYGIIRAGEEEFIASFDLPQRIKKAREQNGDLEIKVALYKDIVKDNFEEELGFDDKCSAVDIAPEVEANPAQTGVYVSRIKIKQKLRRLEYLVSGIEKLATIANINGKTYPIAALAEVWKKLAFASFHDSITGTHSDTGYEELMETFDDCEQKLAEIKRDITDSLTIPEDDVITVFNPHAFEVTDYVGVDGKNEEKLFIKAEKVPAFGFKTYKISDAIRNEQFAEEPEKAKNAENEYYRITVDGHGITGIYDKEYERELIAPNSGYANELILEHDVGDPWGTREGSRPRLRLGRMSDLKAVERYSNRSEICFSGSFADNKKGFLSDPGDYRVLLLKWEQKVILWNSIKRIDFVTSVYWSCFDRRIRISFPTYLQRVDDGYYAVPYGVVKRKRYDRVDNASIGNPDGDWPAVEWFSTAAKGNVNVAVLNRGTPSSRIEEGELLMSVLRSPSYTNCLVWPETHEASVLYNGMRDQGGHTFEYALTSFKGDWKDSDVTQKAYQYNSGLVLLPGRLKEKISGISIIAESTEIAAFKEAERQDGLIMRLNEFKGRSETVEIIIPFAKKVYETNLLEKETREISMEDGKIKIEMGAFKLKTIKIKLK